MNDLGSLATEIVSFAFSDDTGRFPVTYVSGWLETNVGLLDFYIKKEVAIDSTGAFSPVLTAPEKSIYKEAYSVYFYDKASRDSLRFSSSILGADWISFKEGDTYIQKSNPTTISKAFYASAQEARSRLNGMIFDYNRGKCGPIQVAGKSEETIN